jgi:hypothetical protein
MTTPHQEAEWQARAAKRLEAKRVFGYKIFVTSQSNPLYNRGWIPLDIPITTSLVKLLRFKVKKVGRYGITSRQ